jgi:hypothetical protein
MLRRISAFLLLAVAALVALASSGARAGGAPTVGVAGVDANPFSATVHWHVSDPGRVVVEVGVDDRYGIWSPTTVANSALSSQTMLSGLEPATTYSYRVTARWLTGSTSDEVGSFRTDPWPLALSASVAPVSADGSSASTSSASGSPFVLSPSRPPGVTSPPPSAPPTSPSSPAPSSSPSTTPSGTPQVTSSAPLRISGNPIFPRMVWKQCPTYYPESLAAGIDLFLGVDCSDPGTQLAKLAGRAMSTVDASTPGISGPDLVGWHLPDEADSSVAKVENLADPKANGRVTFLTLTDHFSERAAPLPNGKSIYPALYARADFIGFDTYPIEGRCKLSQIDNVYWMQRELAGLVGGKPTFQWIEAGPMEHCLQNADPNATTVRAETWLAIAGGARGIGYFPDWWVDSIRSEVRQTNGEITALAPALLSSPADVSWSTSSPVRIGARRYNGALYVIAVNTSTSPANASFTVPGLGGRKLRVFRDGRTVSPAGDMVTDKLPGLGVAIYVLPPLGW